MLPQKHQTGGFKILNPEDSIRFKDYSFDYERKTFNAEKAAGLEALKEWVHKALDTPQGRYIIYPKEYGLPLEQLIAEHLPPDVFESEAKRIITECLLIHPSITNVQDFTFRQSRDRGYVTFAVVADLGEFREMVML